jgi:hypothetical protein
MDRSDAMRINRSEATLAFAMMPEIIHMSQEIDYFFSRDGGVGQGNGV